MPELFSAILRPSTPNYDTWLKLLGSNQVPLKSAKSVKAEIGGEKGVEVYLINLAAMTLKQRSVLLGFISRNFGVPVYEVEKEIAHKGFPIRAEDVIVSYSLRAFL
jgi:hypothetical protein